jgi:hypothetical protein
LPVRIGDRAVRTLNSDIHRPTEASDDRTQSGIGCIEHRLYGGNVPVELIDALAIGPILYPPRESRRIIGRFVDAQSRRYLPKGSLGALFGFSYQSCNIAV